MRFKLPANLKLQKLIDRYPPKQIRGFHQDKVYFVCHSIIQQMSKLDDNGKSPRVGVPYYVPLSALVLKDILGNGYKELTTWMIRAGIIEIDDHYIVGERAKLYKLSSHYNTGKFKWVSCTSTSFKRKQYHSIYKKHTSKFVYETRLIGVLEKHFNSLTIDKEAAYQLVDEIYLNERKVILSGDKKSREIHLVKLRLRCHSYRSSIDRVNEKAILKQDRFGHRLHTPITGLKKEFRQFVRYNGQRLVEIDLSNSQLFFILPLLDWRNWGAKKERRGKISLNSTIWQGIEHISTNTNTIMFLKCLETRYGKGIQSMPFAHDACDGIVYERLVEVLDEGEYFTPRWNAKMKRDYVKRGLLSLLFACPRTHRSLYTGKMGQIWNAFKTLYPEVGQVIEMIKGEDYKTGSKLLQRIESFCMIRGVCKTIKNGQPHIPIFTLHDCIVTIEKYVEEVKEAVLSVVSQITGFIPAVKVKKWEAHADFRTYSISVIITNGDTYILSFRRLAA